MMDIEECFHYDHIFTKGNPKVLVELIDDELSEELSIKIFRISSMILKTTFLKKADTLMMHPSLEHLLERKNYKREEGVFESMKVVLDSDFPKDTIFIACMKYLENPKVIARRSVEYDPNMPNIEVVDSKSCSLEEKLDYQKKFRGFIRLVYNL